MLHVHFGHTQYLPIALPLFALLAGALALLLILVQIRVLRYAYMRLGMSSGAAFFLLFASLFGSYINIPIAALGRRDAAALAGLAPWTRQSGEWKGKSFISGGRKIVRTALYMGALVAAQHNQTLKAFRNRLVGDGKPKKLAIIAAARKLLTMSLVAKGPGNGPDKTSVFSGVNWRDLIAERSFSSPLASKE